MDSKTFETALFKLRNSLRRNRFRVIDFCRAQDRLRCGFVNETQFLSAIGMCKVHLTAPELESVLNAYKHQKTGLFNYVAFSKEAERASESPVNGPIEEQNDVFRRFAALLENRRISLHDMLVQYDIAKIGRITRSQMYRVLAAVPKVSPETLRSLVDRYSYSEQPDMCDYIKFLSDLEEASGPRVTDSNPFWRNNLKTGRSLPEDTGDPKKRCNGLLQKLQHVTSTNRVRLLDFFRREDKLRHGTISSAKFSSILGEMRLLPFKPADISALQTTFQHPASNDLIRYIDFCKSVEKGRLDKSASEEADNLGEGSSSDGEDGAQVAVSRFIKAVDVDAVAKDLKNKACVRAVPLREYFRPLRHKNNRVRFARALAVAFDASGMATGEHVLHEVCRHYESPDASDTIDVDRFFKDVL